MTKEIERPHVVILGAGASVAAFPNGDRNGRRLPLMNNNFVDAVGLTNLLAKHGVRAPYDDFEAIWSDVVAKSANAALQKDAERIISDYFAGLALPDEPTLYDHLILSLRQKDVIATFNWDPLFWHAAARNHHFAGTPRLLFLHGNVALGYCPHCKVVLNRNHRCSGCGGKLQASPLLFPVKQKNYQAHAPIAAHWRNIEVALGKAWAVTFFGYGAPRTDIEAVALLKKGWGDVTDRNLEETEIIDIREENDLVGTWSPFIHTHHYQIKRCFYDSLLAKHPRRSCEALWARLMECQFLSDSTFPRNASFADLYTWLKPKLKEEGKSERV